MKNRIQLFIGIVVLLTVVLACGGSAKPTAAPVVPTTAPATSVKVVDVYLATDDTGDTRVTSYTPDQPFFAIVEIENPGPNTVLKADWYAVDVPNIDPNYQIDDVSIAADGNTVFTFDLTGTDPWPLGEYRVDLYIDDVKFHTINFEVVQ